MKKLIAILVVFAVVAGAVFAEASIGGGVGFGAQLIEGDSSDKDLPDDVWGINTLLGAHWGSVNFSWTNDDGNAGAKIKLNGDFNKNVKGNLDEEDDWDAPWAEENWPPKIATTHFSADFIKWGGMIWWQPISFLKLTFTNLEDEGVFGRGNAIDWGYQSNSAAGNTATLWGGSGWNSFSNATLRSGIGFFGGLGGGGQNVLALSLYPINGLAVNLAWSNWSDTAKFFEQTLAQITYELSGIGNFAVSFKGKEGYATAGYRSAETLAFDFSLNALSGMNIEIGAKIPLAGKDWDGETDMNFPIEIGLGFAMNQWSGDAFKLFARAGVLLPSEDFGDITAFGLDINPSYDIGLFRVYFDFGIAVAMQKDNDDTDFFWHLNPYLRKGIGIGDLYVGFNIWNGTARGGYEGLPAILGPDSTKIINFSLPIYFEVSF